MDPEAFRNSPSGRLVRAPGSYWAFVPNPLPPELTWTPELIEVLSQADRALGELAGLFPGGRRHPIPGCSGARARRLQDLRERYRDAFQTARGSARLLQVVDLLFAQPVLAVRQVETALGVNFPAAKRKQS